MWNNKGFDIDGNKIYICSECKAEVDSDYPFCPYCGQKQEGNEHEQ